jgi:three-Cys-motif partner protein
MATQKSFYKPDTERKLQAVANYLQSFLQVLSKQNFETIYVDAFAGSGTIPLELGGELLKDIEDAKTFIEGSALRALKLEGKFSRYVFIEKDARKLRELKSRIDKEQAHEANVEFIHGDAAAEVSRLCLELHKPNVRSVVFLDPFGSQVSWTTLEDLAKTKHVDLWYLFPAGLSVNRQISSRAETTQEQEDSLNRLFGRHDWKKRFLRTEETQDLFGSHEFRKKDASIDDITRFMIECMGEIFAGKVHKAWLPLGRDGAHWYSLIFAMANPSKQAQRIGHDIAKSILTRK